MTALLVRGEDAGKVLTEGHLIVLSLGNEVGAGHAEGMKQGCISIDTPVEVRAETEDGLAVGDGLDAEAEAAGGAGDGELLGVG